MAKQAKQSKKYHTTRDMAEELDVESKTLRVWLRGQDLGVGRGREYRFTDKKFRRLVKQYKADHTE